MKKVLLILVLGILLSSCEKDDNNLKCGKIISLGWDYWQGNYIKIDTYPNEMILVENRYDYKLNSIYCY